MLVPVVIAMLTVTLVTLSAVIAATSVFVTIRCHDTAAKQRNGSGQQHKNGLHKVLLFTLFVFPTYPLDRQRDVGKTCFRGGTYSYSGACT
jgi:hypothetical protein